MKKVTEKKKAVKKVPIPCLARSVEFATVTWIDSDGPLPRVEVIMATAAIRELLDQFPDSEVDDVFVKELKRRMDSNGERLVEIGRILKCDLVYPKDEKAEKWSNMLL